MANSGNVTYSNQIFESTDDFTGCPRCKISLDSQDYFGGPENVPFKKVIDGATTDEFRLMRGESLLATGQCQCHRRV